MALIKNLAQAISQPSIDKARLMNVMVDPPAKTLQVSVAKGYEEDGKFVTKSAASYIISGADYDALMQTAGDAEQEVGTMLEEGIWAKLEAMGVIDVA